MPDDPGQGRARILVVDDNEGLLRVLRASLEQDGHEVHVATDGREAVRLAESLSPDVVILDVMMPGLDGWQVCDRLRRRDDVAIILLTVRDSDADVIRGFRLGADDYLTKPFSMAELKARVEAKLRRTKEDARDRGNVYDDGTLLVDLRRSQVFKRGEQVSLSPKEYRVLAALVRAGGAVVSHDALLREVWGPGYESERAYLAIYVRYLRQRIEDDPGNPTYIRTHRGAGYAFAGWPSTND